MSDEEKGGVVFVAGVAGVESMAVTPGQELTVTVGGPGESSSVTPKATEPLQPAVITVYKDMCISLWHARLLAQDFGPKVRPFPQEEESLRAECLELLWKRMTLDEKTQVTAWVEANRPEVKPFESDHLPQTPEPPLELKVVPVMMGNGDWAWFQGAPDGVRYVLAASERPRSLYRNECFLVASFDARATPPTLIGIDTYSESCHTLTLPHSTDRFYADLAVGSGDSYEEARRSVMQYVDSYAGLRWVRERLGKGDTP